MNGLNTSFTLNNVPNPGSLQLFLNGLEQTEWYTLSGDTITFKVAPKATDQISAKYTY